MAEIKGLSTAQIMALEKLIYGKNDKACDGKLAYREQIILSKFLGDGDDVFELSDLKVDKNGNYELFKNNGLIDQDILKDMLADNGASLNSNGMVKMKNGSTSFDALKELNAFLKSFGFSAVDGIDGTESDHLITAKELAEMFKISSSDATKLLAKIDKTGNGYIGPTEFMAFLDASGILAKASDGKTEGNQQFFQPSQFKNIIDNVINDKGSFAKIDGGFETVRDNRFKNIVLELKNFRNLNNVNNISNQKPDNQSKTIQQLIAGLGGQNKMNFLKYRTYVEFADQNGDGLVNANEQNQFLASLNKMSESEYNNFMNEMKKTYQAKSKDYNIFRSMDANKDGKLTYGEVMKKYTNLTGAEVKKLDANKDGKISKDEFLAFTDLVRKRGNNKAKANNNITLNKNIFKRYLDNDKTNGTYKLKDLAVNAIKMRRSRLVFLEKRMAQKYNK